MAVGRSGWLLLVGIAVAGVVGYEVQRKLPPYEMGFHEPTVQGEQRTS